MSTSAALIVKNCLHQYLLINAVKTRHRGYGDPWLACRLRVLAYELIHEMDKLINAHNSDNIAYIKQHIREQIGLVLKDIRVRQGRRESLFQSQQLPSDFSRCLQEAWFRVQCAK